MVMRPIARLLLLCLAPIAAGCSSTDRQLWQKPLQDTRTSAARIYDRFLSPAAMARDLNEARNTGSKLIDRSMRATTARQRLAQIGSRELERIDSARAQSQRIFAREGQRLAELRNSRALDELTPTHMARRIRHAIERAPEVLGTGRRALPEHDDRRHRTDPSDDGPEASWAYRILRRILP